MNQKYQDELIGLAKAFFDRYGWTYEVSEGQRCKRFDITYKHHKANLSIYETGKMVPGGPSDSPVKLELESFKNAIENKSVVSDVLPFEIETFPEKVKVSIPEVDPIIVKFLSEAILCYKADSLLGCTFLLGAASETAIWLLIEVFTNSIELEASREKFKQRTAGGRFIGKAYAEFKKTMDSSFPKPQELMQQIDIQTQIESIFQFCRMCRNEVGYPQISRNFDKGVVLANLAQFVKYLEAIYKLIKYYDDTKITI